MVFHEGTPRSHTDDLYRHGGRPTHALTLRQPFFLHGFFCVSSPTGWQRRTPWCAAAATASCLLPYSWPLPGPWAVPGLSWDGPKTFPQIPEGAPQHGLPLVPLEAGMAPLPVGPPMLLHPLLGDL